MEPHEWTWRPAHCVLANLEAPSVSQCLSHTRLSLLGDSMVERTFLHMNQTYYHHHLGVMNSIEYLRLKSPLHSFVKDDSSIVPSSLEVLRDHFARRKKDCTCGGTLVFNPAALWQCAYGELRAWKEALPGILQMVNASDFDRIFFVTSTAVHPIVYTGLARDRQKWSLTNVRVKAFNDAAALEVARYNEALGQGPGIHIQLIDVWPLSDVREDDPEMPGDMRHYGSTTMQSIVNVILTHVCL
jgi:hypothetical protein